MYYEVLIFVQQGCQACHEIRGQAEQICTHYSRCVRWRFVDAGQEPLLADAMQIRETPTVIATTDFYPAARVVGGDNFGDRLVQLYTKLLDGASCRVGTWRGDL